MATARREQVPLQRFAPRRWISSLVAAALVALPSVGAAASAGSSRLLALRGDQTANGPIQFFNDPSVLAPQGDALVRAAAGVSGGDVAPLLLGGSALPLATLAGGEQIQSFDNLIAAARAWARFSSAAGPGVVASDIPEAAAVVAGAGAPVPFADLFPRQFAVAGDWVGVLEGDPSRTELLKLTAIAPFTDPPRRVEILQAGDEIAGLPVTAFVSESLTLDSSGNGMVTVARNGLDHAVVRFDAGSAVVVPVLAVGDNAPGFAPAVDVVGIRSGPRLNASGAYTFKTQVSAPGTPEVIYVFSAGGGLIDRVQEGAAVPDAVPAATFTQLGNPFIGVTGSVFLYRRRLADESTVPALGMLDLAGGFRTLAVAGENAPGDTAFTRFDAFMAMNPDGVLVFRAQTQTGTSYFALDTADVDAAPYRVIGPGDQVTLPAGPASVSAVGTIAVSGGEDGLGTSLNDAQLVVTAGLQGNRIAVVLVNVVDIPAGGDANCDGATTAADFAAVTQSLASDERSPCRFDDVNGDGRVAADDLDALVAVVFE